MARTRRTEVASCGDIAGNPRGEPTGIQHAMLEKPRKVPFSSLTVDPARFSVRDSGACNCVDRMNLERDSLALLETLAIALKSGEPLDALLVFKEGETLTVFDGHHRHLAMYEAGLPGDTPVWVQVYKGTSERGAREFALQINRKGHLAMHHREVIQMYWKALVCEEVTGSVRGRADHYKISPSTVQRMDTKVLSVREKLRAMAAATGREYSTSFIRANAPRWKDLSTWENNIADTPSEFDPERAAEEKIIAELHLKYAATIRAQPRMFLRATIELVQDLTGEPVRDLLSIEEDEESRDF